MTADNNPHLVLTRFLMARAHSAWLAATRLALSTQTVEAYPLLRAVIENAWYALHLAHDPAPPARAMTWLRRAESEDAKARREGVLGQECAPDASVLAGSSVDHPAVAWRIVARLAKSLAQRQVQHVRQPIPCLRELFFDDALRRLDVFGGKGKARRPKLSAAREPRQLRVSHRLRDFV